MRILIIIFFISINILYSQNIWELNYYSWNEKAYSIEAITDSLIYLYSNSGTNNHLVYKSINQGKSWEILHQIKLKWENFAFSMSCPDSNSIFIGMRPGKIYRSLNGGKSFEFIQLDTTKIYHPENIKMLNKDTGVVLKHGLLVTKDGWKTYTFDYYLRKNDSISFTLYHPNFNNDSIITCIVDNERGKSGIYFGEFNINTFDYKLYWIDKGFYPDDLCKVSDSLYFTCGKSNIIDGGSGHDAIHKSTDGGKTWRRVLDLYSDLTKFYGHKFSPFGLQSIAFKDSLTGIAVGQFGKILYTYDGGESWIYEAKLHDSITQPPTMLVRYAGSFPIIGTMGMEIYRMIEDNLAPKPEDTITISGRVWEGNKGQPGIPVVLGYRVTMTDSNGYYKFTRVANGNYVVHAVNKYFDAGNPKYDYKPFKYVPERYDFYLSSDTSGIDFNAIDLRTYHSISGKVVDNQGKGLIDIDVRFARSVITPNGLGLADTIIKTDQFGKFEFNNIESYKTWDITAYDAKIKFSPLKHTIRLYTDDTTDLVFIGTPITSVEEKEELKGSIVISPNPAREYITINLSGINPTLKRGVEGNVMVEIYDVMGVLIHSTPVETKNFSSLQKINVSNYSPGVYFVKIGDKVEKFVKY